MSTAKVYVGNLAWKTDKEGLEQAFAQYATSGKVEDAVIINDRETGRSRGFGFVTFASTEEAEAAIQAMNGQNLDDRTLKVNMSEARSGGGGGGGFRSSGGSSSYSNNSGGGYGGYGQQSGGGGGGWGQQNNGHQNADSAGGYGGYGASTAGTDNTAAQGGWGTSAGGGW